MLSRTDEAKRLSPMHPPQSVSRVLDPMEVAPWRDVGGNQSDGATSPDIHGRNFSPNSSLNNSKGRSNGGDHGRVGIVESLLGGTPSPSASRPSSNLTNLPLPKFNPMINTSDLKMSPSGDSSPKQPDSPTNLFSRLKLFAKNSDGQSALNKSLQTRHVQFGSEDFEGELGELTERVHSYSPSSSSSRLHTSIVGRASSFRPHLSKHHPSLSLGGAPQALPYPDDEDSSYHPFLVEPGSGASVSLVGAPPIGSVLSSGISINRRSVGSGFTQSGASANHEGGLQGQTQAALQQLLKEGGKGKADEGPPRIGRLSLGGALKSGRSGPISFISPEAKGHRRVPSGDGKEDDKSKVERTTPTLSSALRTSPGSGPSHNQSGGQHVTFRRISSGRSSAPGHGDFTSDSRSEPSKRPGLIQLSDTVDEDERF
jgi:hypothetical protein